MSGMQPTPSPSSPHPSASSPPASTPPNSTDQTAPLVPNIAPAPILGSWLQQLPEMSAISADDLLLSRKPQQAAPGFKPVPFGPYELLEIIGRGGMGVVYRARQHQPQRMVAVKLVLAEKATGEVLRRFEREIEILGRLQHPNITQIYDAGQVESPSGPQSYFAMELVEGTPINRYVLAHNPPTHEILRLFLAICAGMSHAHENKIIHRDLKPSNILVTANGQPKIMDFGIARMLDKDPNTTYHTTTGQFLGTLAYISPEQAGGGKNGSAATVDARSDIYALGILLFELLTGHLPYRIHDVQMPNALRMIMEDEPSRLTAFNHELRGDLETIVAKALEKEPARRYATVAALAADVQHFLLHEPIAAKMPSVAYRSWKFVRRHKALVLGTSAVILTLLIGLVATYMQYRRANLEAHEAKLRLAEGLTEKGNLQYTGQQWEEADQSYAAARHIFHAIQEDDFPAQLGRWHNQQILGREIQTVSIPELPQITQMCQMRDGQTVVLGHANGQISLVNLPCAKIVGQYTASTRPITQLLLPDTEKYLWMLDDAGQVICWSMTSRKALTGLIGQDIHKARLVAVNDAGTRGLLTSGFEIMIQNEQLVWGETLINDMALSAQYTPDGKSIVYNNQANELIYRPLDRALTPQKWKIGGRINRLFLSSDGQKVYYNLNDHSLNTLDLTTGTMSVLKNDNTLIVGIWDFAAALLMSDPRDRTCTVQAMADGERVLGYIPIDRSQMTTLPTSIHPALPSVLVKDQQNNIHVYTAGVRKPTDFKAPNNRNNAKERYLKTLLTPDGKLAFTLTDSNRLQIWDVTGRRLLHSLMVHTKDIKTIYLEPDLQHLWIIHQNANELQRWNYLTEQPDQIPAGLSGTVGKFVMDHQGNIIFSNNNPDGTCSIKRVASKNPAIAEPLFTIAPPAMDFILSADDSILVVTQRAKVLHAYDLKKHREIVLNAEQFSGVSTGIFLDQEKFLYSKRNSANWYISNLRTGATETVTTLSDAATTPSLDSSGRWLVLPYHTTDLIFWDVANRKPLQQLRNVAPDILSASWIPQTRQILITTENSPPRVLDLQSAERLEELSGQCKNVEDRIRWYIELGFDSWAVSLWEEAQEKGHIIVGEDIALALERVGNKMAAKQQFDIANKSNHSTINNLRSKYPIQ